MWYFDEEIKAISEVPVAGTVGAGSILFLVLVVVCRLYDHYRDGKEGKSSLYKGLAGDLAIGLIVVVALFYALGFTLEAIHCLLGQENGTLANALSAAVAAGWPDVGFHGESNTASL